jgi:hypothetical protein
MSWPAVWAEAMPTVEVAQSAAPSKKTDHKDLFIAQIPPHLSAGSRRKIPFD